jgi:hypothetical protein
MSELPERCETLNETLQRKDETWTPEITLLLIEHLREQRDRWSVEQQAGSRKRVSSKQIGAAPLPAKPKPLKPGRLAGADKLKGLML